MDVLCLGIFVADILAKPILKMPDRGKLALIDEMELQTGGCANNTSISLARLGVFAGAMGKIGKDGFGDFILRSLKENRVDVSGIVRDDSANTSLTFVMIAPDGERTFFHYIGANAQLSYEDVNFEVIKRSKFLHVAGSFLMPKLDGLPTAKVLKKAKELGLATSLDTAWNSQGDWLKVIEPCLSSLDIFLPSIEEASMISSLQKPEEISAFFLDYGIKIVGLKMGANGSYFRSRGEEFYLPAYQTKVVDATGAGDAFAAGFLAGIAKGWDLEKSAKLANAAGAACVRSIGCTRGIKNLQDTLEIAGL